MAQPEKSTNVRNPDKFIGVYAVFGERNPDYDSWEDYGEGDTVDTEFGSFQLPSKVLFAHYEVDRHRWVFPGLDGYCAFATTINGDTHSGSDGLQALSIGYKDSYCNRLSGSIYIEKSDETYFVTFYEVYETPDGRIYTNGDGNSSSAPATAGGGMTIKKENTYRENGEVVDSYEFEVAVKIEPVIPTQSLTLVQYDADDVELSREDLTLKQHNIVPNPDTAWMVVIETDKEGTLHRSAYEPPEDEDDWTAHNFYLAQEDGTIQIEAVFFEVSEE